MRRRIVLILAIAAPLVVGLTTMRSFGDSEAVVFRFPLWLVMVPIFVIAALIVLSWLSPRIGVPGFCRWLFIPPLVLAGAFIVPLLAIDRVEVRASEVPQSLSGWHRRGHRPG